MKRNYILALIIFFITAGIYILSAVFLDRTHMPKTVYFNLLADAFLHGRIYLTNPPSIQDLTNFDGKWYVPFLPLPALLLLPWVAFAGLAHTNTIYFGCVMGALNTALVFLLLQSLSRRTWNKLTLTGNAGLTLLFGLGSIHWYMSIQGSVWFLSQICTTTFVLFSLWIAVEFQSPLLSGLALGVALFGRPNVILIFPLLLAIVFKNNMDIQPSNNGIRMVRCITLALLPIGACVILILGYNYLRFQNVFDFGYQSESVLPNLKDTLSTLGQFNLNFVPHNLWALLLAGPDWDKNRNMILPNVDGLSIFITTPALIYLHRSFQKNWLAIAAWFATGLSLIPLLTYYNTGWWQFGYRYSLDFMPAVMLLLAIAARERISTKFWILITAGILINAWGTWWFMNPTFF